MLVTILAILVIASWMYWLVAWWWTRSFLTGPQVDDGFAPPVSLLKPLRGIDAEAYDNFVSFLQQDYPDFELLFGVDNPTDPVIPVVERLQREFPLTSIRIVVASSAGPNRKATVLEALAAAARCEVLVISDSDMRVTTDYLRRVVAPLADERIGLVTCSYRGENPVTLTARLEALHMTATFLPSVMVARRFLSMRFAMGATVAVRRTDLERIGGFASFAEYLADDYQLGVRIAQLGSRVQLSNYVVGCILGATTFREQWTREVRWQRTNRVNRPREYPGMLITFSTPLSVVLVLVSGLAPIGWEALLVSVVLRWVVAWLVMGYAGNRSTRRWLFWLPLRDMLSCMVWCVGAVGQRIVWRGEEYVLLRGGRMQLRSESAEYRARLGALPGEVKPADGDPEPTQAAESGPSRSSDLASV